MRFATDLEQYSDNPVIAQTMNAIQRQAAQQNPIYFKTTTADISQEVIAQLVAELQLKQQVPTNGQQQYGGYPYAWLLHPRLHQKFVEFWVLPSSCCSLCIQRACECKQSSCIGLIVFDHNWFHLCEWTRPAAIGCDWRASSVLTTAESFCAWKWLAIWPRPTLSSCLRIRLPTV